MAIAQIKVKDIGTLIAAARKVMKGFGKSQYFFRGHADERWTLVPAVHRSYDNIGERNLAGRFRLGAPTRSPRCPEFGDLPGWLSLMQHYGLPTRLLDWTGSLLTAAYFAARHEPLARPGAIWVLVPSELNNLLGHDKDRIYLLHGSEARPLLSNAFEGTPCEDEVLAVLPVDLDLRMTVQIGGFTFHATPTPLEERTGADHCLVKFVIPESAKPTFAEELWVLGARRGVLFPDLDNLAVDLATDDRLVARRQGLNNAC
jgi:hypothetical protein